MKAKLLPIFALLLVFNFASAQDSGDLQVSNLAAVDASAIGTLTDQNGGFGVDFWQAIAPQQAIELVTSLPNQYRHRQLLRLARKILLTAAPINSVEDTADNNQNNHDFIVARIEKLYQLGLYADANAMLQLVPGDHFTTRIERIATEVQLLLGNPELACTALTEDQELPHSEDNFWQKFFFFCAILDNRNNEAELIVNFMAEVQGFSPSFVELAHQALGIAPADTLSVGDNDAISFALQERITPSVFNPDTDYNISQLWRLTSSPAVSDSDKILVALRLFSAGVINAEQLLPYYGSVPFYKGRANATYYTEADYSHAFQLLADSNDDKTKAKIIIRLIDAAAVDQQLSPMLEQLANYMTIEPAKSLKSYSAYLGIAELYNGDLIAGDAWSQIANSDDKAIDYDVLAMLSYSTSYYSGDITLSDIYNAQTIESMPLNAILAANDIMQARNKPLLTAELWESLMQRDNLQDAQLSYKDVVQFGYIASLVNKQSLFLSEFLKAADNLADSHPAAYIKLWQMSREGNAPRAVLDYFLTAGFFVSDN